MSLIWFGWTVREIRELRATTVGTERGLDVLPPALETLVYADESQVGSLSPRHRKLVHRFAKDVNELCGALGRVARPGAKLVLVVADSQLRGVPISNSGICASAAALNGFELVERQLREIPARHRYLPPPGAGHETLGKRMKEEIIYTFARKSD